MEVLTQLKPKAMGMYSASTSYIANSLVMSTDGAKAYLSVKAVPAGTPLTNTEYWKVHTDLSSARESALAAADKANAARDEMLEIARGLTDPVEVSGNPVSVVLAGRLPFDGVTSSFAPIQAGSGEPSLSNIRAISGWTGANLTRCGKNLFGGKAMADRLVELGGTRVSDDTNHVTIAASSLSQTVLFANFKENTRYTFILHGRNASVNISNFTNVIVKYTDGSTSGDYMQLFSGSADADSYLIYTTPEGKSVEQFRGNWYDSSTIFDCDRCGIFEGMVTLEDFEAYQDNSYAATFPQTIYGGTLDWVTGLLTVTHSGHTFDGTEQITRYNNRFISQMLDSVINSYETDVVCSHYPVASSGDYRIGIGSGTSRLEFWDPAYTTADAFKEYLAAQATAGTPVQIAYKLAKPTTIQLTAQEIAQLSGTNTLYGDGGAITIHGRQRPDTALLARIEALEGK